MRIGIVGGGLMGFAVAHRLSAAGHAVTVLEHAAQPGGLATWHDYGGFFWDRFYHVVLPSDAALIDFISGIGLRTALRWRGTRTGYYVDGQCHSLDAVGDFIRFPLLGLWDKTRLAMQILYCSRLTDWRRLEQIGVEEFLVSGAGRPVFEKFWKPLLLAKLGPGYRRVSAVFIWSYIRRLFSARHSAAGREQLGHVSGGYKCVFEQLQRQICARAGCEVMLGVGVKRIESAGAHGMRVVATDRVREFDKVIFTAPVDVLRATTGSELVSLPAAGKDVEYLGVVCTVLVTRSPIVPYYVLNIADSRIPFTGVIGMSNVVDPAQTAGLHLTYLPKYVLSDDPCLQRPDAEVQREVLESVQAMFPNWSPGDLVGAHVNRATRVQPLQVIGYSSLVPAPRTRHDDFYVLNTSQLVGGTLNNNEVIQAVNGFFATHGRELGEPLAGPSTGKAA